MSDTILAAVITATAGVEPRESWRDSRGDIDC